MGLDIIKSIVEKSGKKVRAIKIPKTTKTICVGWMESVPSIANISVSVMKLERFEDTYLFRCYVIYSRFEGKDRELLVGRLTEANTLNVSKQYIDENGHMNAQISMCMPNEIWGTKQAEDLVNSAVELVVSEIVEVYKSVFDLVK